MSAEFSQNWHAPTLNRAQSSADDSSMPGPAEHASTPYQRLAHQLKISGGGTVGAVIGVPIIMSGWTPGWFPLVWTALYLAQSGLFLLLIAYRPTPWIWQAWANTTGIMFSAISVAALIWGLEDPSAPWMVATISIAFIGFEAAILPYLDIPKWWTGSALVGVVMTIAACIVVGPLIVLGMVPLLASLILVAGRNKTLSNDLDQRLAEAEAMLGTDPLTELLNRRGLEAEFGRFEGKTVTLAMFDADRFKHINDTQGHGVGDQVLELFADHLRTTLPSDWTLARYGGDEFVAFAPGAVTLDERTVAPLQMSLSNRQGHVNFSFSAGVATGRLVNSGDRLLSEAGYALRQAKRDGQNVLCSTGSLQDRFERSKSITLLDQTDSPIVPVAQVIVNDKGVVGCELLARWQGPDGSLLSPAQFMDMLAENGLLGQLDDVMLEHAVVLAAQLEEGGLDIFVSANVAASHLLDVELPGRVSKLLDTHGVEPDRLMIEITESERLGKDRRWEAAVQGLHDLGIMLAIDDFGAGYSSVARLRHLPITHLKLDMALVQGASGPLGAIVRGVTQFCLESDIGVVAEGIETEADHQCMLDVGVDVFQGYLFGRPVRIEDLMRDLVGRSEREGNPAQIEPTLDPVVPAKNAA